VIELLERTEEIQPLLARDGNFCWTKTDLMLVMGTSVGLKLILLLAMA
jgi:hypothetical protein